MLFKALLLCVLALTADKSFAYSKGLLPTPKGAVRSYATGKVEALSNLPKSYDSVAEGYVGPIRNQGNCGSCYAHATAASLEAAWIKAGLANSITRDLSERDKVLNDKTSYGCRGGFMTFTFEVQKGLTAETYCPYKPSSKGSCKGPKVARAVSWAMVGGKGKKPSIEELKAAIVEHKVLAVTVAAGRHFDRPDKAGKFKACSDRGINHMVNLVGYRTLADGTTEFKIRNSWGTGWGAKGYAWARQGCNQLASTAGDAAMFVRAGEQK